MTTLEHLRSARAHIDTPDKWGQKVHDGWTGTCASNALIATDAGGRGMEAWWALVRVLGLERPTRLFDWNDTPGRTHADVMAAFDRAIAVEEAKQQEFTVTPIRDEAIA